MQFNRCVFKQLQIMMLLFWLLKLNLKKNCEWQYNWLWPLNNFRSSATLPLITRVFIGFWDKPFILKRAAQAEPLIYYLYVMTTENWSSNFDFFFFFWIKIKILIFGSRNNDPFLMNGDDSLSHIRIFCAFPYTISTWTNYIINFLDTK